MNKVIIYVVFMRNYLDKFKINNTISLVTGGSGGIGQEVCKALLDY